MPLPGSLVVKKGSKARSASTLGNPRPGIAHRDLDPLSIHRLGRERDPARLCLVRLVLGPHQNRVMRVGQEIEYHLAELAGIAVGLQVCPALALELDRGRREPVLDDAQGFRHGVVDAERFEHAVGVAREHPHIGDDLCHALDLRFDPLDLLNDFGGVEVAAPARASRRDC